MEEYKYRQLPITSMIIEELILKLFNGKLVKRDEIVNKVLEHHLMNEGKEPEVLDFPRSVKTTLSQMSKKGIVENVAYGYWKIHDETSTFNEDTNVEVIEETEDEIPHDFLEYEELGEGNSSVYVYYFESYKELSMLKGEESWPCKIGMSERDPKIRILSQVSTALPELPKIAFIIKTDKPSLLEIAIHSILKLRDKQIEYAPGTEWFNTNPEEILEIIKLINVKTI